MLFEGDPREALAELDAIMREISTHTEPQALVNAADASGLFVVGLPS